MLSSRRPAPRALPFVCRFAYLLHLIIELAREQHWRGKRKTLPDCSVRCLLIQRDSSHRLCPMPSFSLTLGLFQILSIHLVPRLCQVLGVANPPPHFLFFSMSLFYFFCSFYFIFLDSIYKINHMVFVFV